MLSPVSSCAFYLQKLKQALAVLLRSLVATVSVVMLAGCLPGDDKVVQPKAQNTQSPPSGQSHATSDSNAGFHALDVSEVQYAQDWSMPDVDGVRRTKKDYEGKAIYILFGYAQCPEICPVAMLEAAELKAALGADGDKLQVVFVTVDPERDTPELMRKFVTSFDEDFTALVGSPDEVATMAKDFRIYYKKIEGQEPDTYTIDHSSGSYVFDPKGNLRLYVKYGTPVDHLAADIRKLLNEG